MRARMRWQIAGLCILLTLALCQALPRQNSLSGQRETSQLRSLSKAHKRAQQNHCRQSEKARCATLECREIVVLAKDPLGEKEPSPFKIMLYEKDDVVTSNLLTSGEWETTGLAQVQYALARVGPGAIFLDIGANLGWYTLHAAAQGAQVFAFEPMPENLAYLRSSLCLNQQLAQRITVVPAALGTKAQDSCVLFSSSSNHGDGIMDCSPSFRVPEGYEVRQEGVRALQLDSLMKEVDDIGVIKMDIEGHEVFAVAGGNYTFFERQVPYIMLEYSPPALTPRTHPDPPVSLLEKFAAAQYRLSIWAFDTDKIQTPHGVHEMAGDSIDVYMTHQSVFDAMLKAAG